MHREVRLERDLPEQYANLFDYRLKKFETPLDSLGIADIDATFDLAIRTFPDDLPDFSTTERNIHHLYWTERFWKDLAGQHEQEDAWTIQKFRNGTPQLAYIPKPIHAWIEESMIPPPPPPLETMRRRNAAWSAAAMLLSTEKLLETARNEYETNKDKIIYTHAYLHGLSPVSSYGEQGALFNARTDRDYLLSELNARLEGWRAVAETVELHVPEEDRIIPQTRLTAVRALRRRIRKGAIVPRVPISSAA